MNAIVLAGGFGSRLRPFTDDCPKPMLPVANRPVLDYAVAQLKRYGIDDVVFTLGYMPERIADHATCYKGIRSRFSVETEPLGTAGGVKKAASMLDDVFVVLSGDAISDVDLGEMIALHLNAGALVTMAVVPVADPRPYGIVTLGMDGVTATGFVEKPDSGRFGNLANAGIYVMDKRVLDFVPDGAFFDFSRDLFPSLLSVGGIKCYRHEGYWCDVGDKASYFGANFAMKSGGFYPFVPSFDEERHVSRVKGESLLGAGAVTVGGYYDSVIGAGARIASGARVYRCVVLPGALVTGRHRYSVIGRNFVEYLPYVEGVAAAPHNIFENFFQTGL